jgi:hypothetical protein
VPPGPAVVRAPLEGVWRVGRGENPLAIQPVEGTRSRRSSGANRSDPGSYDFGVLYFGSTLQACFAETLARLRPSVKLLALVEDEWRSAGFMDAGSVPADWRQRRTAVHVGFPLRAHRVLASSLLLISRQFRPAIAN